MAILSTNANTFDTASMPALSEALPRQETVVPKKAKVLPQAGKYSAVQQFLESDTGFGTPSRAPCQVLLRV